MRRFVAVVIFGWMLAAPASAAEPVAQTTYLRAFWQGAKAYVKGDFAEAQRAFQAALAVRPDAAAAHDNLGESLFRAGRLPEAAAEFQKAMETSDRLAKSRAAYNLGNTMVKQSKLEDAAAAYKKALRWNENDDDARWNLNVVMRKLEEQKKQQQQQKQDKKDQKDQRDQKQPKSSDKDKQQQSKSDKDKQQSKSDKDKQQSKSDKDKQQSKSDKDKQQSKSDRDKQQHGKGSQKDPQQGKDKPQAQRPSPSPSAQPRAQAKPSPSPSSAVAGTAERGDPSMSRADAERILRYFQEKERSHMPKQAPNGRTWTAAPGEQTW